MNPLIEKLKASILSGRTTHAYLISGTDREQTVGLSRELASLMMYSAVNTERLALDPDYHEYEGSIPIGEFRDVIRPEIYRETFGKNGRVAVFLNASLLSESVQNAMLKVLEEPPANTHFILTGSESGILSTVRSRCLILRCASPENSEIEAILKGKGASDSDAATYALMSGGSVTRAIRLFESEDERKLRDGAITALIAAMNGVPDYKWSRIKRDKGEWYEANEIILLVCHDMLKIKSGLGVDFCRDREKDLEKCCSRFTIGEIGGIINEIKANAERLSVSPTGGAAFDRLFSVIAETAPGKRI
ncbi:MAG: hypothetical protein K6F68_09230 [Clostridiales bacterium]|nr:hypothetical protein [Clostridiales bacterium]